MDEVAMDKKEVSYKRHIEDSERPILAILLHTVTKLDF